MSNQRHPGAREILVSLRAGQQWLTKQNEFWLAENPKSASDTRFSVALSEWDSLERVFRCSGYEGCIWGVGSSCPKESPVICDGCVSEPSKEPENQLVLGVGA
jgi:hypothetical protein